MSVKSRSAASCGSALNTSALRLFCPGDFSFLRDLMAAMISSFPGGSGWHPGLSLPLVYLPLLVVVFCSELYWSVPSITRLARLLSWEVVPACPWSERQCLHCNYHTSAWRSCRLYPSPLLAASSAWLARSFMWLCLSVLAILFTVRFASLHCCLYLSFSCSDLVPKTFFLRVLLFSMTCQASSETYFFLFLCFVPRQALQVCS